MKVFNLNDEGKAAHGRGSDRLHEKRKGGILAGTLEMESRDSILSRKKTARIYLTQLRIATLSYDADGIMKGAKEENGFNEKQIIFEKKTIIIQAASCRRWGKLAMNGISQKSLWPRSDAQGTS